MSREGWTKPSHAVVLLVLVAVSASIVGEYVSQGGSSVPSPDIGDRFPPLIASWDSATFLWINVGLMNLHVGRLLSVLTLLGSFSASAVLVGSLFLTGQRKRGVVAFASVALVTVATAVLKAAVARPRPFLVVPGAMPLDLEGGWSFPSGHASRVFSLVHLTRGSRRSLPLVGHALAGLVAFSRVYLGVHYPLDVLGGMVLGLASGRIVHHYEARFVPWVERAMERLGGHSSNLNTSRK